MHRNTRCMFLKKWFKINFEKGPHFDVFTGSPLDDVPDSIKKWRMPKFPMGIEKGILVRIKKEFSFPNPFILSILRTNLSGP